MIEVHADEAIAAVLRETVVRARAAGVALGGPRPVRLGCPAMWDGGQRRRMLAIATAAGLPVAELALVDEPVAAGVAWLAHRYLAAGERPTGRLLVFDMGGGTLDVAVLAVTGGPQPEIAVQSCLGMPMAGDALDIAIARDLAGEMAATRGRCGPAPAAGARVGAARTRGSGGQGTAEPCRRAPRGAASATRLSARDALPTASSSRPRSSPRWTEPRAWSSRRCGRRGWRRSQRRPRQLRAIRRAELAAGIDFVLLVGGMSRIPYVARRLAAFFPDARLYDDAGVPPEEAVVAGPGRPGRLRPDPAAPAGLRCRARL